ncbi:helix-hairpin-helix domain-containing protein [Streptomyces sp. ACA25]|nr:helix-hairpin-helix domain-containing protein [Streptomyces sp. ACA25]MDB1089041.1 helix-hairpin-helix domain-containing protein [Streptomyces sp. ACA25]
MTTESEPAPGSGTGRAEPAVPRKQAVAQEQGPPGDPGRPAEAGPSQDRAEALRAAVRAVESGEQPAAAFFSRPEPPPRPQPVSGPSAPGPVPEGLPALLSAGGAPESLAGAVAAALGEQAEALLRSDPWQLLAVAGVRPEQADAFARALLGPECGPGDARRAQALTVWLLERAARAGHTAVEPGAVSRDLAQHAVPDPDAAVREAIESGAVLVLQDPLPGAAEAGGPGGPETADGQEEPAGPSVRLLLGLDRYAVAEESLADGLARLRSTFSPPSEENAAAWEAAAEAAPSPSAAELIRTVAGSPVVVHTGGEAARAEPAALATAAGRLGLRTCAAAHTEDGRHRLVAALSSGEGEEPCPAVTVSGLLAGREGPGRDEEGALALDLLIVLDAPQLSAEDAAALVESLPDEARLVLSGDPHVLGSAGAGQVLADVRASGAARRVVSRTPDPGPVGELVSGIAVGELNRVEAPEKEVVTVPVRDPGEAVHRTVQLVTESIPRAFGAAAGDIPVITPGHGGAAGTRALNAALKERLNPGPGRFGGFDTGDRISYSPAPGHLRPGTVTGADSTGLQLDCGGLQINVAPERVAGTVRHGWALTAHQAVGHRWPAVVVVLPGDAGPALDRSWVYTAFSRAERHLSVVQGVGPELARAVTGAASTARTTRLPALLPPP